MIDEKSLRIGNWVKSGKYSLYEPGDEMAKFKIGQILNNCVHSDEHHSLPIEFGWLHPIPLTPTILEQCGFKKEHYTNEYFWKNGNVYLSQYLNYLLYDGNIDYLWSKEIQFVHELQNLYYSLTGTELNIQL